MKKEQLKRHLINMANRTYIFNLSLSPPQRNLTEIMVKEFKSHKPPREQEKRPECMRGGR